MEEPEDCIISGDEMILLKPPIKRSISCNCKFCPYVVPETIPPHFTEEDLGYCCRWCRLSNGKKHGNHCEKIRKYKKKKFKKRK